MHFLTIIEKKKHIKQSLLKNPPIAPEDAGPGFSLRPLTWNSCRRINTTGHADGESQVDGQVLAFRLSARGHLGDRAAPEELPFKKWMAESVVRQAWKPRQSNGNNTNTIIQILWNRLLWSCRRKSNCPFCKKNWWATRRFTFSLPVLPLLPHASSFTLSDRLPGAKVPPWLSIVRISQPLLKRSNAFAF